MKNITKLINGSILVFVICLMAVSILTGCDNTNTNLRKGQDTNITEIHEDEYQVTREQFDKATDLRELTNLKITSTLNDKQKNEIIVYEYSVYNDNFKMARNGDVFDCRKKSEMETVLNVCNNYNDIIFNKLEYDKQSKSYIGKEIEIQTHYLHNLKFTFKNKILVGLDAEIYLKETNELLQTSNAIYEYDCVEPFELGDYQVTEEEFNSAMRIPNNYRGTSVSIFYYDDGSTKEEYTCAEYNGQYYRFKIGDDDWSDVLRTDGLSGLDYFPFINHYNDFEFKGVWYYASNLVIDNMNLYDVELRFEDKKLISYKYKYSLEGIQHSAGTACSSIFIEYDCVEPFEIPE